MAMSSLRLRRAVTSTVRRFSSPPPHFSSSSPPCFHKPSLSVQSQSLRPSEFLFSQSRAFRASTSSLLSARGFDGGDEIGPDTILFEGCDYNHWLIVMDFPKDNKPSPEEMVRTYEETCAKGLNISVDEAKQKMYACSTTTYTGFQAVMTEEESEKFNGLPGVIFVLPDSYIDPQNKEYGGDKYMNGTIIPRPPPIQYGRQQTGRYRDQPKFDRPRGPMPNQDGPQGSGFGPPRPNQQGQGFGPPRPNQPGPGFVPPRSNQPGPGFVPPTPNQYGPPIPNPQGNPSYAPHYNSAPPNYPLPQHNYPQPDVNVSYQQGRGGPPPPQQYQGNFSQGGPTGNYNPSGPVGNYYPPHQDQRAAYPPQQQHQGDQRNYGPPPTGQQGGFREDLGSYGQGSTGQGGFGRN